MNLKSTMAWIALLTTFGSATSLAQNAWSRSPSTQSADAMMPSTARGRSLSPPSLDVIRRGSTRIKIVSLLVAGQRKDGENRPGGNETTVRLNEVSALLDEYTRAGRNITVETIDPQADPARLNALLEKMSGKHGFRDLPPGSIVVMGLRDIIAIPPERMFRKMASENGSDGERIEFTGERQITLAIALLGLPRRPRVAFVRNGGPPFTAGIDTGKGVYTGPLHSIAAELGESGFDVVERDFSDLWALQLKQLRNQNPSMALSDEASDEQLKDSVWIARPGPATPQEALGSGPPNLVGKRVAEHINDGGAAMVLFGLGDDEMTANLAGWGVRVHTDRVIVHERPPETRVDVSDQMEALKREQMFWGLSHYGNHPITRSMQLMECFVESPIAIASSAEKGVTAISLAPLVDGTLKTWDKDIHAIKDRNIKFDANTDTAGPFNAAVAIEKITDADAAQQKAGGARLLAIGCSGIADNQWVTLRECDVRPAGSRALRLPGNSEFVINGVLWLSRMEDIMNIAPQSRSVARD